MERKRIVITGLSAITPLGNSAESSWEALLAGKSGIGPITLFDSTDYPTHIAGEVKDFKPEEYIPAKECRKMDRFSQFAVCAAIDLMKDAGLTIDEENAHRVGVVLGVGLGGLKTLEDFHEKLRPAGPRRVSPFYIPMVISNMAPGLVAIETGAKGINVVSTSACASALHAIGCAYDQLVLGRADAIITGGIVSTNSGVQVVNKTGSMLPETGGLGTLLFTVLGSTTALGTGVVLVTKKRMSKIEDEE